MREKSCCFTGHRTIPINQIDIIKKSLLSQIKKLMNQGVYLFYCGGALGFDTLSALTILQLKNDYPNLNLILVLPCENQSQGWKTCEKETYDSIRDQANTVIYTSKQYYKGCMQKRNRYMVDNCSYCICYLTKKFGGTSYTVDYATKHCRKIINLAKNQ